LHGTCDRRFYDKIVFLRSGDMPPGELEKHFIGSLDIIKEFPVVGVYIP
jgi:hypothetical protein